MKSQKHNSTNGKDELASLTSKKASTEEDSGLGHIPKLENLKYVRLIEHREHNLRRWLVEHGIAPTPDVLAAFDKNRENLGPSSATAEAQHNSGTVSHPRQAQLKDREKKLWEVIQRGVTGLMYCREVDKVGVQPKRNGAWRDCPRKYESAYREGDPWRHLIQDEKSKVRRKAELAGLAKD